MEINEMLTEVIKGLLKYSLEPIKFDYDQLTNTEKQIVKDPRNLSAIKNFIESNNSGVVTE